MLVCHSHLLRKFVQHLFVSVEGAYHSIENVLVHCVPNLSSNSRYMSATVDRTQTYHDGERGHCPRGQPHTAYVASQR